MVKIIIFGHLLSKDGEARRKILPKTAPEFIHYYSGQCVAGAFYAGIAWTDHSSCKKIVGLRERKHWIFNHHEG